MGICIKVEPSPVFNGIRGLGTVTMWLHIKLKWAYCLLPFLFVLFSFGKHYSACSVRGSEVEAADWHTPQWRRTEAHPIRTDVTS
jgi:hypothetical protein